MKRRLLDVLEQWMPSLRALTLRRRRIDPETGLWLADAFVASAEQEVARASRFRRPLALLAIEVRPSTHPSQQSLQGFADALRRHTRGFDLVGRTDDGIFLVLLPEASAAEAAAVVERIIGEARTRFLPPEGADTALDPLRIGVALFPNDGAQISELIAHACTGLGQPVAEPAPSPPADQERIDQGRLHRFVAAVVVSGLLVFLAALLSITPEAAFKLAPFMVLMVIAERLTPLRFGKGQMTVSLGAIVSMTAAAVGGPPAGAVTGLIMGLVRWHSLSLPSIKGLFNIGVFVLSSLAAGAPYWFAARKPTVEQLALMLVLGLAGGIAYFIVNYVLLATVLALSNGSSWLQEWRLRCQWLVGHYAVMGSISVGLAALYESHGLTGLLLLLGPVGLLYYAQRQYVTHTVAHVTELSSLNQELAATNQRLTYTNGLLEQTLGDLRRANRAILASFSEALEFRDQETEGHSQRVVHYARAIAEELQLPAEEIDEIAQGAMLHDIGKMAIPDSILLKPGKLTAEEWAEMKRHPDIGYRMIAGIPFLASAALLVRHHHEWWNGRGYPSGLAAYAIPLGARIFAVADAFDAMTSDRPYRAALSWEEALRELTRGSGQQFDPTIVTIFVQLVTSGRLRPIVAAAGLPLPDLPGEPTTTADEAGEERVVRLLARRVARPEPDTLTSVRPIVVRGSAAAWPPAPLAPER